MNKDDMRQKYQVIRNNVENKLEKSDIIKEKLTNTEAYKKSDIIALYYSFPFEVNTLEIMKQALIEGKKVILPRVMDKETINFYSICSIDEVIDESKFGVIEPSPSEETFVEPRKVDLVVVPGVCFDENKNRLGFGKGYYDRYLSKAINAKKIGLAFQNQILIDGEIPTNKYDVKVDMIITEDRTY